MLHLSIEISNKGTEQQCSVAVLWQSLSLLPRRAATATAAPLYGDDVVAKMHFRLLFILRSSLFACQHYRRVMLH